MIREYEAKDKESVNTLGQILKDNFDVEKRNSFEKVLVYVLDGQIVGFIEYMKMYEVVEIEYIVVSENKRRMGIGRSLIQEAINNQDVEKVILEVKTSNTSAIEFYKRLGFNNIRVIKNYYEAEDAIAMEVIK